MSNTIRPQSKVTVVEEGTEFRGTLTSSCPIDVRGRVEGDLQTPALTVSASGAVHGRVKVGEVRSEGEISGEFDADKIELAGTVRDNTVIRARSLDVKIASPRGKLQLIFGECELAVGDEPRETDHLEPTLGVTAPVAPSLELALAPAPAPVEVVPAAVLEASAQAEADDGEEDADGSPVEGGGKRKRRRKNGQDEHAAGWSQPPSQPPPAS